MTFDIEVVFKWNFKKSNTGNIEVFEVIDDFYDSGTFNSINVYIYMFFSYFLK